MGRLAALRDRMGKLPWFAIVAAALVLVRFAHLGETIDGPHSGRQCDTAFYALDFYRSGLNLLRPSVCWLGAHKALALEFPLPEAITAALYHLLGPRILWARLVTLAFFLGAVWFLHCIVAYVQGERTARLVTLLYLAIPLAMVYSRAVHVDFAAVFFAHGMLYCLLRGYDSGRTTLVAAAGILGAFAFAIKAPYAFFLALPFALSVLRQPKWRQLLKWSPWLALPIVAFALWRHHAWRLNDSAPDLSFIPNYFKFTDMGHWYYGPLAMRLDPRTWLSLGYRTLKVIPGALGLYFLALGLLAPRTTPLPSSQGAGGGPHDSPTLTPTLSLEGRGGTRGGGAAFFALWLLGAGVSLLIFFKLNVIHDYYQIPFIAPIAYFIAQGLEWAFLDRPRRPGLRGLLPFALTMAVLLAKYVHTAEVTYYDVDEVTISAGAQIRENTPRNALVIASVGGGKQAWWFDPRLLYRADRLGWSVPLVDLGPAVWEGLKPHGATHIAILSDQPIPVPLLDALAPFPPRVVELPHKPWALYLYSLAPPPSAPDK